MTPAPGPPPFDDKQFIACVDLLGRMGAKSYRVGYSDEEDGDPIVWYAVAEFRRPGHDPYFDAAGALDPLGATFRLCERFCDGGKCTHCGCPTGVTFESASTMPQIEGMEFCWYAYDPEMHTFRRMCEGAAA